MQYVANMPLKQIVSGQNPRTFFCPTKLEELCSTIKAHGVFQPILVKSIGTLDNPQYQIIAGERRWRAAQKAGLHEVPVVIREASENSVLELALIENIQRQDLNPIEEAEAYKKLTELFGHSAAELAELVHKSRSHVANMMRLLDLPPTLRDLVTEEKLSMGHARALLGSDNAVQLAMLVIKNGLSVRATEALVQQERAPKVRRKVSAGQSENADIRAVESHLGDLLGLKVRIAQKNITGAGAVTFEYGSLDQLDMLCQRLTGEKF